MKKLLLSTVAAIMVPFVGVGIATAQDEEGPPNFVPVELNVCSYEDRKDQDDFDDALKMMTDWMEENDSEPYAAFRLFPAYAGDQEFDFVYFGGWPNGSAMGRDLRDYWATAEDAQEAWDEAVDCNSSEMFASINLKSPESAADDDFMLSVSDCNVAEGRRSDDALDAIREWGAYRDVNGSPGGTWAWFPIYGDGNADFDFKLLNSHAGPEGFGNFWQWIVDRAAYDVQGGLLEGLLDCDVARMYVGETIVNTWPDSGE